MLCNCQTRTTDDLFLFSPDSLTIYDGASSTSPMMGEYCGNSIPPSHVSSINEVLIIFQSNSYGTYGGFQMEYNPIGKRNNNHIDRCRILGTLSISSKTKQFKTTLNIIKNRDR